MATDPICGTPVTDNSSLSLIEGDTTYDIYRPIRAFGNTFSFDGGCDHGLHGGRAYLATPGPAHGPLDAGRDPPADGTLGDSGKSFVLEESIV